MSEQARTPGVSPAQIVRGMIRRKDGLGVTVLGFGPDEVHFVWTHAVRSTLALRATEDALVDVLSGLWREAQVTALESVAKEECDFCARGVPVAPNNPTTHLELVTYLGGGTAYAGCKVPRAVRDLLSRLRQSESAPGER